MDVEEEISHVMVRVIRDLDFYRKSLEVRYMRIPPRTTRSQKQQQAKVEVMHAVTCEKAKPDASVSLLLNLDQDISGTYDQVLDGGGENSRHTAGSPSAMTRRLQTLEFSASSSCQKFGLFG